MVRAPSRGPPGIEIGHGYDLGLFRRCALAPDAGPQLAVAAAAADDPHADPVVGAHRVFLDDQGRGLTLASRGEAWYRDACCRGAERAT